MFLTEIWYAAGELEAAAGSRPSWARLHEPNAAKRRPSVPRRALGRALIRVGKAIAAETSAAAG